ncbi:COP9 signalosome catalytic subunit rri1 [Savitreella phatthalungensis]
MTALAQFSIENDIKQLAQDDEIFRFDVEHQKNLRKDEPWASNPRFFTSARISALALVKMTTHARSGGDIEVMGLMQGKVTAEGEFIVLDSFALPVEGTETRVNAGAEAYEYMFQYKTAAEEVGRIENVIGWYHSHPGYGCWLSGIDVGTQKENQRYQDPFLAVVIDPHRTIATGKVEIGAFRVYPEGYQPDEEEIDSTAPGKSITTSTSRGPVPSNKIDDFGVHANQYYPLEVSHFKSSLDGKLLDALWSKYWVATLAANPLAAGRDYTLERLEDVEQRLRQAGNTSSQFTSSRHRHDRRRGVKVLRGDVPMDIDPAANATSAAAPPTKAGAASASAVAASNGTNPARPETELDKLARDLAAIANEQHNGVLSQQLKVRLFQQV